MMNPGTPFVYVTYINTTPEKVWTALTDPDFTQKYWGGRRVKSDWKVGSPVTLITPAGKEEVRGEVLRCDPPKELAYTFRALADSEDAADSRVTFKIAQPWGAVQLTVIHEGLAPESRAFLMVSQGWPAILSSLKTLLETGAPLPSTWKG